MNLTYDDVYLVPQRRLLKSRSEAIVGVRIGEESWKLPVIPANMRCSIDREKAIWMAEHGYFYIMHRFEGKTPEERLNNVIDFVEYTAGGSYYTSISIGETDEWKRVFENDRAKLIDCVTIDVAHADSPWTEMMIQWLKKTLRPDAVIIAGNIATPQAAYNLWIAGANYVKVGIGQGKACTTRHETGFTMPMFSCVKWIHSVAPNVPIIADGGCNYHGDIAKAIVAGADLVMAGSMFAACSDSPAPSSIATEIKDGFEVKKKIKIYYGSASYLNGNEKNIEGTSRLLEEKEVTYEQELQNIEGALRSAASYAGVSELWCMRGAPIWRPLK